MARFGTGFEIELSYRFARDGARPHALSHPLVALLRAVRDGGSIKAAAQRLGVSCRHAWARCAQPRPSSAAACCGVQGEGSVLTPRARIAAATAPHQRHAACPRCSDPRLGHRWEHRDARRFTTPGATACATGPARCSRDVPLHARS